MKCIYIQFTYKWANPEVLNHRFGGWSSAPKRWANHFLRCGKLGAVWGLVGRWASKIPIVNLGNSWNDLRKLALFRLPSENPDLPSKRHLWFNMRCCRSFMLRPQGYQGHERNTETPSASRSPWWQRCFQRGWCCELRKHDLIDPDEICGMSPFLCAESGSGRSSFQ